MSKYELDLLGNATDSLNEALVKYQQGRTGNDKAYKFCILHFSHFLELLFKYYVTQAHPLLIYKNPFAKKLDEDSFTIGLGEAIQFLKNEGHNVSKRFSEDLDWIKSLRNKIEHHKFSMNVAEVEEIIGRLMNAVYEFDESHENIDLSLYVGPGNYDVFHELANTYIGKLKKAEKAVEEAKKKAYEGYRPKDYNLVNFQVLNCPECGHDTFITNEKSSTGCRCTFCDNEESDEIEVDCGICGVPLPKFCMTYTDNGLYICEHHFK